MTAVGELEGGSFGDDSTAETVAESDPIAAPEPTTEPATSTAAPEPKRRRSVILVALGVVVVAGAVGTAYAVGRRSTPARAGSALHAGTTKRSSATPSSFVSHHDPDTDFSISYPKTWTEAKQPDGDVRLLLSAGDLDSLLVRVVRLEGPVTQANLGDLRSVTDAIVTGSEVKILEQRTVTLNGMPGYYYLYTFKDSTSGAQGVHAHYFLFQGRKMNILVFQALPIEHFNRLATTFDQVAESFTSGPDTAPASTSSTAAGSATSTTAAP